MHNHSHEVPLRREILSISIALLATVLGMIFQRELHDTPFAWAEYVVFLAAYFLAGWRVLYSAARNLLSRPFDENFLMSIATIGAIAIHQLPEAVAVMLFFRIGEALQSAAVQSSRRSITSLLELRPDRAYLKEGGEVSPEEVRVGQLILVRPGDRVPLDGEVMEGKSRVDTSALTGESVPRGVSPGDPLLAGMVNGEGLLTVKVTTLFQESSIAKILKLVESAGQKKAKTERFITKLAQVYTPIVVLAALALAFLPSLFFGEPLAKWIYRSLVLLVISCPCGLVISIPLGYFGGIGGAAKRGILVKGATFLDALAKVRAVAFDKTGTLTKGTFKVTQIVPSNGFTPKQVLHWAAAAETHSTHPIARSIIDAAQEEPATITSYEEIAAHGIRAQIGDQTIMVGNDRLLHRENISHETCLVEGTVAHVVIDHTHAGYIVISDEIRDDAKSAIKELHSLGIKLSMLTGDSKEVATRVSKELELDQFFAELIPEEKVQRVEEMLDGGPVAFVGDGINDAPVLTRADIGIAMGGLGSDAAIETADVVIMGDLPSKVPEAIKVGRKTRTIVIQNIFFALAIKTGVILLGAFGIVTLWEAIFADVGVALLAILNATRALR